MTGATLDSTASVRPSRRLTAAAVLLGGALSAFLDGILLHQVLQWHHLLSLAEGATWRDLHNQILADGVFHVLVYILMLIGLRMLWRARGELAAPGAGRRLAADLLIGFGLWNVIDIVGFHWLAGIHRVRVDVANPLPWDIGWLLAFGAAPLGLGAWLRRGPAGGDGGRGAALLASSLVILGGLGALAPPEGGTGAVVVFRPDVSPAQAIQAVAVAGGLIADMSPSGRSMVVILPGSEARWSLYANGALLVGGGALAGCGTTSFSQTS